LDGHGHLALLVFVGEIATLWLTDGTYGKWVDIDEEWLSPMSVPARSSARERDNDLLVAVAAGNRQALEELYLGYHRRLARFLSRFTPRYENVEEIINDTFMVVWQSAKDFRYASQVSTWIIGIAYRTALKSLRRQKNHAAARSLDEYPEQTIDPTFDAEVQDWLKHGLSQLPAEQRLTLELAYHMGHSLEEIAVITECPVGTVKARMFHAREKLRHYLPSLSGSASEFSARNE
jgi:RNA polymerase sigma-70 factor (ECF subfamily)